MKKYFFILFCLLEHYTFAQSLSPGSFASSAGSFVGSNAQLDFNLGETNIGLTSNSISILSAGTLQPNYALNTIPLTQLRAVDCGKLNLSPDAQFAAVTVTGATLYHFEFRDASSGIFYGQRITSTHVITPNNVQPVLQWNHQYLVRVKVYVGGQWGEFGASCTIGLMQDPAIAGVPSTNVRTQYCNNPAINLLSTIVCNPVTMGNSYEFEFTNTQNGTIHNYVSLSTSCQLSQVNPPLLAGVNYQVQIRARVYTTWGNYGTNCSITPATPQNNNREEIEFENDSPENNAEETFIDIPQSNKLIAYPNPFNEQTDLLFESPIDERVKFTIYDLQGRIIYALQGVSNIPENLNYNLIPGSYLLVATSENGTQHTTQILKIN